MKILHCAETIKGGVATVLKQIAAAQISSPECERIICLVPDSQREELHEIADENIITFKRKGRDLGSFIRLIKTFTRQLLKDKPDIVHLHSTFSGVLARLVLIVVYPIHRPKVVYCPHAFSFLMESSSLKQKCYVWIERFLSLITDKIICVSDYERNQAVRYGLNEKKLVVIHNGVPQRDNAPRLNNENKIDLLFVGRLDFQKGYDLLVSAMKKINDPTIHLTIVGDSVNGETEKVALDNITYTGWIKSNELEKYFLKSDALVIPSRWEGFAMVPLEAMSYSLPVVASDSTSLPEVVHNNDSGFLFRSGDANDLRNKILALKDVDLTLMGEKGNKLFSKAFTSRSMIEKTALLYQQIGLR